MGAGARPQIHFRGRLRSNAHQQRPASYRPDRSHSRPCRLGGDEAVGRPVVELHRPRICCGSAYTSLWWAWRRGQPRRHGLRNSLYRPCRSGNDEFLRRDAVSDWRSGELSGFRSTQRRSKRSCRRQQWSWICRPTMAKASPKTLAATNCRTRRISRYRWARIIPFPCRPIGPRPCTAISTGRRPRGRVCSTTARMIASMVIPTSTSP